MNSSVRAGWSKLLVLCIAGAAVSSLAVVLTGCSGGGASDQRSPTAGPQTQSAATAPSLTPEASGTQAGTAITIYAPPT